MITSFPCSERCSGQQLQQNPAFRHAAMLRFLGTGLLICYLAINSECKTVEISIVGI